MAAGHGNPTKSFFLRKEPRQPDFGFTTGTCAAAASAAAARMLLTRRIVPYVILTTPRGIKICVEIENQRIEENRASCSARKFSGDDPDVTDGIRIFSTVTENAAGGGGARVTVDGGEGVGRVTLPGLDQKVGEAAINRVPREMIAACVTREIEAAGADLSLSVVISAPGGAEIAGRTFNPRLGIIGGISILGTSGIVEPMSEQAVLDTIQTEMNVRRAQGFPVLPLVPGNYGSEFLEREFGLSLDAAVHCSNFVFDSVRMAARTGFRKLLFCGHIGKLVKVAGGVRDTHSKHGDRRMEILCGIARNYINDFDLIEPEILSCVSTGRAVEILDSIDAGDCAGSQENHHGARPRIMREIAERVRRQMSEWSLGEVETEVVIFTNEHGVLAQTPGVRNFISLISAH